MLNNFPPIVVVAYNRPKSLSRLLKSLSNANYFSNNIDLIISIEKKLGASSTHFEVWGY